LDSLCSLQSTSDFDFVGQNSFRSSGAIAQVKCICQADLRRGVELSHLKRGHPIAGRQRLSATLCGALRLATLQPSIVPSALVCKRPRCTRCINSAKAAVSQCTTSQLVISGHTYEGPVRRTASVWVADCVHSPRSSDKQHSFLAPTARFLSALFRCRTPLCCPAAQLCCRGQADMGSQAAPCIADLPPVQRTAEANFIRQADL